MGESKPDYLLRPGRQPTGVTVVGAAAVGSLAEWSPRWFLWIPGWIPRARYRLTCGRGESAVVFDVGLGDGRFFSRLKRRFRQGKAYGPCVLVTGFAPVLMVASGTN